MTKTATLATLSSKCRNGESAMVTSETELTGYPLVEAVLNAIADWVTNYRNAIGFKNEFGMCGPDELERMAKDIGVTPSQLQELIRKGPDSAKLLKAMLAALHVDPKTIAEIDPLVMREMKWLCITCNNRKRCKHELAKGTATEHFHEYCPNAISIDELLNQKGQLTSH
jgi:transcriptional regulator with XRE-family HTH domain